MKNKKGNATGVAIVILLGILTLSIIGGGVYFITTQGTSEETVGGATVEQIAETTSSGDVALIKVYTRDLSNNNINTKVAVATYCQDDKGNFIIDGTSSSTTAEISGSTTRGRTITCWAFNSTYQTKTPAIVDVNEEVEHVVIDVYAVPTTAQISFYNDQYQTGSGGTINVTSVGASATGTLAKMRVKNNNTDKILPIGGVYFATVTGSNVSDIDLSGSATLSGFDHSSTMINPSDLSTSVSTRKDNWDYVFEIDDNSAESGNQALLIEENDYLESGSVKVKGDGDGCTSAGELISSYGFTRGYYRATKDQSVKYGVETDADASAVITSDITGDTFYCTA